MEAKKKLKIQHIDWHCKPVSTGLDVPVTTSIFCALGLRWCHPCPLRACN